MRFIRVDTATTNTDIIYVAIRNIVIYIFRKLSHCGSFKITPRITNMTKKVCDSNCPCMPVAAYLVAPIIRRVGNTIISRKI
jgi:hypothetical protein